ncbi:MAG TPA: nucleotidyltransferase family protein [Bacteroidales bacterium]|nr:nucleotidyltransferase family protein [Bacteroidales bacterium]
MHPTEAIILAGGMGTRLKGVIKDIPKPMAPIQEKPFLEYMLTYLLKHHINHVILSVGYKKEVIESYFGEKFKDIKISYANEDKPLGTGGGIKKALSMVEGVHAFILNGDSFFNVNLSDLSEFYFAHKADLSMCVKRKKDFFRYGTVDLDVCKVVGFQEKQPVKSGLINGGVYITSKNIFDRFTQIPEKFSFEQDFLEKYFQELKICAMRCSEYFIDIGIPADYEIAQRDLPAQISI